MLLEKRKLIVDQELRENAEGIVGGFLRSFRKVGKLYFAVVSDQSSKIQVLFKEDINIKKESVILVSGILVKRKSPNLDIPFGEGEIVASSYEVLSEARKTLPFELIGPADLSSEPTRLKYRYLDLRRGLFENLIIKSKIIEFFRRTLIEKKFVEIQTPALSVSSREGANTFNVEVFRDKKKAFFALSQSPQLYKQLLMMSGIERYFQLANCFRYEDLRSDRQYEFLQIDIEMAFANQEDLFQVIEAAFKKIFREVFGQDLKTPFFRLSYDEALEKYGSDKPDIRYGLEIEDYSDIFVDLLRLKNHEKARGIFLSSCNVNVVEEKWLASINTSNDIYILTIENKKIINAFLMKAGMPKVEYSFEDIYIDSDDGVLILVTYDGKTKKNALLSMGALRFHFSRKTQKELRDNFQFIGIINGPLFEFNEVKGEGLIAHHLFTKPVSLRPDFDKESEMSCGYDLVVNGVEIASGSARNNNLEIQNYVFKLAGLSEKEVNDNFGGFLEAFNYGVPPHLGIALGVDRLVQVLIGAKNIREVIAFPKNNHGVCPLTNAPAISE